MINGREPILIGRDAFLAYMNHLQTRAAEDGWALLEFKGRPVMYDEDIAKDAPLPYPEMVQGDLP